MSAKGKKTPVVTEASNEVKAPVAAQTETKATESAKTAVPEKAKEESVKAATPAPAKKAEETKPVEEQKKTGRKPGRPAGTKNAVKKTAKKVEKEVLQEVYFEYNGQQFLSNELVDRIKEEWKNEGHRIASIKSLRVYVNPEERKAYYVINDKAEGKFVEF